MLTPHYFIILFRGVIISLGSQYFLVNNDWGGCFSLVHYDWGNYYFRRIHTHRYTGRNVEWKVNCKASRVEKYEEVKPLE